MKYVALLRGINVGGKRRLAMKRLKALLENLGCSDVVTYLQSGNVIFSASGSEQTLRGKLAAAVGQELGEQVRVLVIRDSGFLEVSSSNSLVKSKGIDPAFLHVTFLFERPEIRLADVAYPVGPDEQLVAHPERIDLYCPNGYGKTKLNNSCFERKLKVPATTRNWKTVQALAEMLGD
jgi:uncharacterized protein (DUF1697 family)